MPNMLTRISTTAAVLALTAGIAISQVAKPEKAAGPSGGDFIKDMTTWFANHQGAGIALGVGVLVAIGMIIWGRIRPSTPDK